MYCFSCVGHPVLTPPQPTKVTGLSTYLSRLMSLTTIPDPAILADVQRALKMKARREARLKAPGPTHTDASPQSFFTTPSPQRRPTGSPEASVALPPVNRANTEEDFITTLDASVPHPMPRSIDNGATLDWSGKEPVEEPKHERRWSLAIAKRKTKDKATSVSSLEHPVLDVPRDPDYDGLFHCSKPQTQSLMTRI